MASVSIIIPTYNRSASLLRAIESLLAQTWEDLDVIVVDDGSTDDTPAVVGRVSDGRVRYLRGEHAERSVARNLGLSEAAGDYVAFLDDDDICLPHRIACQARLLSERQEVDLVASGFHIEWVSESRRTFWAPWYDGSQPSLLGSLLGRRPSLCASMFRRSALARMDHRFDPDLVPAEDVDFMLRLVLACEGRATWVPEMIYEYRLRRDSPAMDVRRAERVRRAVFDKLFAHPGLPPRVAAQRESVYAWHDLGAVCTAYASGRYHLAQFYLLRSLALHPSLRIDGPALLVDCLALSALLQPGLDAEHDRLVNRIFDHLPPSLASWEPYRATALARVRSPQPIHAPPHAC